MLTIVVNLLLANVTPMYELVIPSLFSRHSTAIYQKFVIINIQFHDVYSAGKVHSELCPAQLAQPYIPALTWRHQVPLKIDVNEEAVVKYERLVKTI